MAGNQSGAWDPPEAMEVDVPFPVVVDHVAAAVQVDDTLTTVPQPIYTTGYVYAASMMTHSSSSRKEHPEEPLRILRIHNALSDAKCLRKMLKIPIREARKEEVMLVHSEDLWQKVEDIQTMTAEDIANSEAYYDHLSLYVHPSTPLAARLSCGGVIEACLSVAKGELSKSFAIVRPPGHHAEPDEHMGFCFFNNVAVATRVVQQFTPLKKILILDWDVHHGNGTQRAFDDDPSVLYMSLHRYEDGEFYPGGPFGSMQSCGEGPGTGFSVNIPWPTYGMDDADYLYAFQRVIMPIAMEFAPDLVIISAGFDAADGDDLGECHVTPSGYAHMTHMLSGLAGGRLVVALEGGYNLDSISASAVAVTRVLLGEAPPRLEPMTASDIAFETVSQVVREQSRYWKCMSPKAVEAQEEYNDISFNVQEILMAHRQDFFQTRHNMMQIPLMIREAEREMTAAEVWCTADLLENRTVVVFTHELGELRGEMASALTTDLQMERLYLIDFTRTLVRWVIGQGFALLDINLLEKYHTPRPKAKRTVDDLKRGIVTYVWDNYLELSAANRIVIIGHGAGCDPVIELLRTRMQRILPRVKLVVQVCPHSALPRAPKDPPELRKWYKPHSAVFVPTTHQIFYDGKIMDSHGSIIPIVEAKPIKLIMTAMPQIQQKINEALEE